MRRSRKRRHKKEKVEVVTEEEQLCRKRKRESGSGERRRDRVGYKKRRKYFPWRMNESRDSDDVPQQEEGTHDPTEEMKKLHAFLAELGRPRVEMSVPSDRLLLALADGSDPTGQLSALNELCSYLSMQTEESMGDFPAAEFVPVLVGLLGQPFPEALADIPLLSARSLTNLLVAAPQHTPLLLSMGVPRVLVEQLTHLEYMDTAEQCLEIARTISMTPPGADALLQVGTFSAVLAFLEFWPLQVQKKCINVAINLTRQMRRKVDDNIATEFIGGVPILSRILLVYMKDEEEMVHLVCEALERIVVVVTGDVIGDYGREKLGDSTANERVESILAADDCQSFIASLIQLMAQQRDACNALMCLTTIGAASENALKQLFAAGIVSRVGDLLDSVWFISNTKVVRLALLLIDIMLPVFPVSPLKKGRRKKEKKQLGLWKNDNSESLLRQLLPSLQRLYGNLTNLSDKQQCLSCMARMFIFSDKSLLEEYLNLTHYGSFLANVMSCAEPELVQASIEISDVIVNKIPSFCKKVFVNEGVMHELLNMTNESRKFTPTRSVRRMKKRSSSGNGASTPQQIFSPHYRSPENVGDLIQKRVQNLSDQMSKKSIVIGESTVLTSLREYGSKLLSILEKTNVSENNEGSSVVRSIFNVLNQGCSSFEFMHSGVADALLKFSTFRNDEQKMFLEDKFHWSRVRVLWEQTKTSDSQFLGIVKQLLSCFHGAAGDVFASAQSPSGSLVSPGSRFRTQYGMFREPFNVALVDEAKSSEETEPMAVRIDPMTPLRAIQDYIANVIKRRAEEGSEDDGELEEDEEVVVDESGTTTDGDQGNREHERSLLFGNSSSNSDERVSLTKAVERMRNNVAEFHRRREARRSTGSKVEVTLKGHVLSGHTTLFEAILNSLDDAEKEQMSHPFPTEIWELSHVLKYRTCDTPEESVEEVKSLISQSFDERSLDIPCHTYSGVCDGSLLDLLHHITLMDSIPEKMKRGDEWKRVLHVLQLLKVFFSMNQKWRICAEDIFESTKLQSEISKVMKDKCAVLGRQFPVWTNALLKEFSFLFPFPSRKLYFEMTSLGSRRALLRSGGNEEWNESGSQVCISRTKVRLSRDCVLGSTVEAFSRVGSEREILEFEFLGEAGTGIGPTLELFSIVSNELCKPSLNLWMNSDNSGALVSWKCGLFPKPWPLAPDEAHQREQQLCLFRFLGQFVARALFDKRLVDLPFSITFLKRIMGYPMEFSDMEHVDEDLYKQLLLLGNQSLNDNESPSIRAMELDFTLPGYPHIILRENNSKEADIVTAKNMKDYLKLLAKHFLDDGIAEQTRAFQEGFETLIPLASLRVFSPREVSNMLQGGVEEWDMEILMSCVVCTHGYSISSPSIQRFLELLCEMDEKQRMRFLMFVTGAPRLPIGGVKSMRPRITIVRRVVDADENVDSCLPTVMTCTNYIKLPDYSSKNVMKEKLYMAIDEGQRCFYLT